MDDMSKHGFHFSPWITWGVASWRCCCAHRSSLDGCWSWRRASQVTGWGWWKVRKMIKSFCFGRLLTLMGLFMYQFSIFPIFDLSKFGMLTSKYSALAVLDINETFLVALFYLDLVALNYWPHGWLEFSRSQIGQYHWYSCEAWSSLPTDAEIEVRKWVPSRSSWFRHSWSWISI